MKLRPIQKEAFSAITASFCRGNTYNLAVCPVGWGKTILSAHLMKWAVQQYGVNCLFLAHLTELILQTRDKLQQVDKTLEVGLYCASADKTKVLSPVTVGSRQSLSVGLKSINYKFSLIIIDEVHLWSKDYQKIVDHFLKINPKCKILGVTGTPYKTAKGYIYGRDKVFPAITYETNMRDMIKLGYLCKYRHLVVDKSNAGNEAEKLGKVGGDYNEGQLSELMRAERHMQSIKKAIEEYATDRNHIIIFAVNIAHGEAIAEFLNVNCVHSKLKYDDWRNKVDRFKSGKDRIIVNINQLSIGFDFPQADCAIMARPTLSPAVMVQSCGRVLRVCDGKKALILDLVGNFERHGSICDPLIRKPREQLSEKNKKENRAKICPNCFEVVESGTCCFSCGAELTLMKEINEINKRQKLKEAEEQKIYTISNAKIDTNYKSTCGRFSGWEMRVWLEGMRFTLSRKAWNEKSINEMRELYISMKENKQCRIIYVRKKRWIDLVK